MNDFPMKKATTTSYQFLAAEGAMYVTFTLNQTWGCTIKHFTAVIYGYL